VKPTRIDLEMTSGSGATFEFIITDGVGNPAPLSEANVEMHIAKGQGKTAHIKYVSEPPHEDEGEDEDAGVVRFTIDAPSVPARTVFQTWWYEIWRIPEVGQPKVHIVGELRLLPSSRID
jgi:hypothetical protein